MKIIDLDSDEVIGNSKLKPNRRRSSVKKNSIAVKEFNLRTI